MTTFYRPEHSLEWKDYDCLVCEDKGFIYDGDGIAKDCPHKTQKTASD